MREIIYREKNWGSKSCIIYLQMSWRPTEAFIKWWRSGSIFLEYLQDHQGDWNHPTKFKQVVGFIDSLISLHQSPTAVPWVPEDFHSQFPNVFLEASPLVSSACRPADEAPRRTQEKTSGTQGTSAGNWAYRFQ